MHLLLSIIILSSFINNTIGVNFECPVGFWGHRCNRKCGHCEGGDHFCHIHDGRCVNGCAHGYKGPKCTKECPDGTHGQYCKQKCGHCADEEPICDKFTGKCKKDCAPGFQMPYCDYRCPFLFYGKGCTKRCGVCDKGYKQSCGCDHVSGECAPCELGGQPMAYELVDPGKLCLNQHVLEDKEDDLTPVKENEMKVKIPWIPIASFMGFIFVFVFGNFIYWYIWVRNPAKRDNIRVERQDRQPFQVNTWGHIREQVIASFEEGKEFRTSAINNYLNHQTERLDRLLTHDRHSLNKDKNSGSLNTNESYTFERSVNALKTWAIDTVAKPGKKVSESVVSGLNPYKLSLINHDRNS